MRIPDLRNLDETRLRDVLVEFGVDMVESPGVTEFEPGSVSEPIRSKTIQTVAMAFCLGASYAEGPEEQRH